MKTIRGKLFFLFCSLMVLSVLAGILMNTSLLEPFYIYKNKAVFADVSGRISDEYLSGAPDLPDYLSEIDTSEGVSSMIVDRQGRILYVSFPQKADDSSKKVPKEIQDLMNQSSIDASGNALYTVMEKQNSETPKLAYVTRLEDRGFLILTKQMKGIEESVLIANEFFALAGVIVVIVGGILMFFFARTVTRPVVEISATARAIAGLDFSRRITVKSKDEIGSLAGSINDISDKLSVSINTLRQDIERRKALVRNISHELKTPIGVIKGYTEGLQYAVAEDQCTRDAYCAVIVSECDRMDRMVRELLDLSLLEANVIPFSPTEFGAGKIIAQVAKRLMSEVSRKDIALVLEADDSVHLTADFELLERALSNLMTNAIKHADGEKRVVFSVREAGDMVRFSVFNTGKNISEDELSRIWDVFYKVDKSRSRGDAGHGIGLSIVRSVAELHGGHAWAANAAEGVIFYIELPRKTHRDFT